ncbi:MAG TPA: BtpA/SgcQ family protein [Planctomycetota bacterium]|nr:BtpA/SgcQ family protein [Planctomycetota bacterium]HRU51654.1 BtpA/SgcQ family protein [Planctomycetota bacterium]
MKFEKSVIGMIHVPALPGTPKSKMNMQQIVEHCVQETLLYKQCGLQYIMIENMHDIPYMNRKVAPEIVAAMTQIAIQVRSHFEGYIGIQILAGANKEALAVAHCAHLDFIRAEGFVFGHVADEGYIDSCAGELLRYRKFIGAERIVILTDIKKKHSSHAITSDIDIADTAHAAEFFLSDGVIVTGTATGNEPDLHELKIVKKAVKIPVLLGSGITPENIEKYLPYADGFIIGSYFKKDGYWENELEKNRILKLMEVLRT